MGRTGSHRPDALSIEIISTLERNESILIGLVLAVALFLRLYNTPHWILANVDEVAALNQVAIPFLSGACTSSNFLLTTVLLKTAGLFVSFPSIRLLNGITNVAVLYLVYRVARLVSTRVAAFIVMALLAFSWNVTFFSRLFECGSFTPTVACLYMCCIMMWLKDRARTGWLYLAGFLLGLHLNTHAMPSFYAIIVFACYVLVLTFTRSLAARDAFGIASAVMWPSLIYLYTLLAFPHFDRDICVSYGTLVHKPVLELAVNFRNTPYFIKTVAEYVTCYPISSASHGRFIFTILLLVTTILGYAGMKRTALSDYCAFFSLGTLLLIGLSPIPVYNEGHLHFFWAHFALLLALVLTEGTLVLRRCLALLVMIMLAFNMSWYPSIFQNQVDDVAQVIKSHLKDGDTVYISDGVDLKLRVLPLYKLLENRKVEHFSWMDKDLESRFNVMPDDIHGLMLTTSDAAWPPPSIRDRIRSTLLLSNEQLFEANLAHGVRIYKLGGGE